MCWSDDRSPSSDIFAPALQRPSVVLSRPSLGLKLRAVAVLFKLRLTSLVVFSAVLGYLMAAPGASRSWADLILLAVAGLLVTGASNALNQVIEIEQDGRMTRTAGRPLVTGVLTNMEAIVLAAVAGISGGAMLWLAFGPLTGVLGLLSLFMYVALYTPLKKHSPWAVLVGAFPGAFPPMLGCVAATGEFGLLPGLLFAVQFIWQFPHFWSIAWVLEDDYKLAGYHLLPSSGGRDRSSAFLILLYALFTIPAGMLPWAFDFTGPVAMLVAVGAGALMVWPALRLLFTHEAKDARRLMFASFLYLPVVQVAWVLDRV